MALFSFDNVKISGISACVPKKIKETRDLKCFANEEEAEQTIKLSSVVRARQVEECVTPSDLCFVAAEKLIEEMHIDKSEIDLLVFVSYNRDYIYVPNTSNVLQGKLGLDTECMSIDLPFACSGYVYGLSVVGSILNTGRFRKALLLVGDTNTTCHSPLDKSIFSIVGDAGTATIIEYCENSPPLQIHVANDGSNYHYIVGSDGGARKHFSASSLEMHEEGPGIVRNDIHIKMDGMGVFSFGINEPVKSINKLCEEFDIDKNNVDYLVLHQANKFIDERIGKKLKFPSEKIPFSMQEFGNSSGSSVPLNIVYNLREKITKEKITAILCGFGSGLSWGSAYVTFENVYCPEIVEI